MSNKIWRYIAFTISGIMFFLTIVNVYLFGFEPIETFSYVGLSLISFFLAPKDDNFQEMIKDRYKLLRESTLSTNNINTLIDQYVFKLGTSVNKNFTKWPILGEYIWPNKQVFDTYQEEIIYLKTWINNRLTWMDSELN